MRRFSMIYLRLIAFAILSISFSNVVKAQNNNFNFAPSNFLVVDKTKNWYNNNTQGFYTNIDSNPNRYQLTDIIDQQTMAMWHNNKIDLLQDFTFSFKLSFGSGKNGSIGIADGVVFVMTTKLISNSLNGEGLASIGYGGIRYSLACEFDTEWNDKSWEGSNLNYPDNYTLCHTSFLQNGIMSGINGIKPIQNDTASVKGKELCCRIEWRRTNGINGSAGYDLTVYTQELGNNSQNGELLERNTIHFATLNNAVTGVNSTNSFVNFGFTSATCDDPNRHEIEFLSMVNGDMNYPPIRSGFIHIEGKTDQDFNFGNGYMETDCGMIPISLQTDTILCSYTICNEAPKIFLSDAEGARWSVLKNGIYESMPDFDNKSLAFSFIGDTSLNSLDTILARLTIKGDTVYFKFPFAPRHLSNYFHSKTDSLISSGMKVSNNGVMIEKFLTSDSLYQSIKLPDLPCLSITSSEGIFSQTPSIINGRLIFRLSPSGLCKNTTIELSNTCNVCSNDVVTFNFIGVDIKSFRYSSCSGLKVKLNNCDGTTYNRLLKYVSYEVDSLDNIDLLSPLDTIKGNNEFTFTDTGRYRILAFNEITGEVLDSFNYTIDSSDFKLPFSFSYNSYQTKIQHTSNGCEYSLLLIHEGAADKYEIVLDRLPAGVRFGGMNSTSDRIKELKLIADCDVNGGSKTIKLNTMLKSDYVPFASSDLLVCSMDIVLPNCCDNSDCGDNCIELLPTDDKNGIAAERWTEQILVRSNCFDTNGILKTISSVDYNTYPRGSAKTKSCDSLSELLLDLYGANCSGKEETETYSVCVNFTDGTSCCDIISFNYTCCKAIIVYPDPFPIPSNPSYRITSVNPFKLIKDKNSINNNITINAQLCYLPSIPLRISIKDASNREVGLVSNTIPVSLESTYYYSVDSLASGDYNVLFEVGEESLLLPFSVLDSSIILNADITPNPTTGITTISYSLKELPNSSLIVRVIDEITGSEQLSFYDIVPALSGSIDINVTNLLAGRYLVVLDFDGSRFYVPKTLQIIKQ